jgi:hypothetical protein
MIRTLVVLEGVLGRRLIAKATGSTPVDRRKLVSNLRRGSDPDRGPLPRDVEAQGARLRWGMGSSFGRRGGSTQGGVRTPTFTKSQGEGGPEFRRASRALGVRERKPGPATPTFAKRVARKKEPAVPSFGS